jgi:TetR/AcrR family transcriptional repressor of mexCD-oprJ operon
MSQPARTLRDRTEHALLEAASRVLAERGEAPTMSAVAAEAGVGRATVYRYFRTREQLFAALWTAAVAETSARLEEARLDRVPVEEAIARFVRTIATVGERYAVLLREPTGAEREQAGAVLSGPVLEVLARGQRTGVLRDDLTPEHLGELLGGLLVSGLRYAGEAGIGVEEASAAVVSVFLEGAEV